MIVMLRGDSLYQDWIPFLLAILYVAIDHALIGTLFPPRRTYNNPAAIAHPLAVGTIPCGLLCLVRREALLASWRIIEAAELQRFGLDRSLRHMLSVCGRIDRFGIQALGGCQAIGIATRDRPRRALTDIGHMEELARSATSIAEVVDRVAVRQAMSGPISSWRKPSFGLRVIAPWLWSPCDEIQGILSSINDIADQTNLLALNAAIEAHVQGPLGAVSRWLPMNPPPGRTQ